VNRPDRAIEFGQVAPVEDRSFGENAAVRIALEATTRFVAAKRGDLKVYRERSVMSRVSRILIVFAALVAVLWAVPTGTAANSNLFSGRATVLQGKVLGVSLPCVAGPPGCSGVVDTGEVAAEGGALEATLLCYPNGPNCAVGVPDLTNGAVGAEVLHASAVAQGSKSRAEASVANFGLTAAGQSISAEFLMANATASCTDGAASVAGSAELVGLVINGQAIEVTGQVDQRITLPGGGSVVINEQPVASASGDTGEITVNALHIVIPGLLPGTDTDLTVAQAHADITCARPAPPPRCDSSKDFVTGGGWIVPPSGSRANFAVAGGIKNGSYWGHLSYIDHGTGMKVKGTGVTAYTVTGPTSRHIEGTAEVDGVSGYTYKADVDDRGEPGRSDTFALQISNGYTAGGKLAGGNIQLHGPCQ
jgi:hypothetical protein